VAQKRHGRRFAPSPRDLYYGWILVVALAVAEATSWGILYYAFTVFLTPMHQELGWSRASLSGAFSLAIMLSGLVGIPMGRWLDRRGARLLMTTGACVAVVLVLAWSAVHTLVAFYLIWAGIGVAMGAVLYEPAFFVVAAWFRRQRGRALGVLTFIAGFASVVFVPLSGWLVAMQGWRAALVTLAIILAVVTIPLDALVLRRRPQDLGLMPDGDQTSTPENAAPAGNDPSLTLRAAVAGATFWLLIATFCLSTLTAGVVFVYLVPYLIDKGYPAGVAAVIVGLIGLAALPGRLVLTFLGERIRRSVVAAAIFATEVVAFLALLLIPNIAGVIAFVLLFGAGYGAVTPTRAALVAEYYGPTHYGSINGTGAFILNIARALAPVSAGVIYALTGGYDAIFWGLMGISVLATVAMLLTEHQAARTGLVAA
jgi:MFS family permease